MSERSAWDRMHDEIEAEQEATAIERMEERSSRWRATPQESYERGIESLDSQRGRTGLHVKHGVVSETVVGVGRRNGDWTTADLFRAETYTGSHYRGRGAEVCPISALSVFDCDLIQCNHPRPGDPI